MPAKARIVDLAFYNRTADNVEGVRCTRASCPLIMQWYGSHYAGDDYDVLIDGVKQKLDLNGELDQWVSTQD
ncbi:hypothetical protein P67b_00051 [Ruegeria phage Tedan]|nr:hypothetical protein P67b_00051 [Ruegeria phage Tedan]